MNIPSVHFQKPSENPDDLHEVLSSLESQSKIAESAELARSGNYGEAEELLKTIKDWQSLPPVLDLMARISAQQGKLNDAVNYWEQAIKLSPSNLSYQAGLEYVTKLKRPLSGIAQFFTWFLRGAGILLVGLLFFLAIKQLTRSEPLPPSSDNLQFATLQAQVQGLYNTPVVLTPLPTQMPNSNPTPVPDYSALQDMSINVVGLKTILSDDALIVYPEKEMFDFSWSFAPGTRKMVTELGRQLEPYSGKIEITLIGFKQTSEKSDFFDVGLTRSNVVFSLIQSSTKLPADIFLIMPPETFLHQPYSSVLKNFNTIDKYVLFLIRMSH